MSYDRPGQLQILENGMLGRYDQAVYLEAYSSNPDPDDNYFAASGTVVTASNCASPTDAEELFGALVIALEETETTNVYKTVQTSLTGVHPLEEGEFELERLRRGEFYRLLVIDGRNTNWVHTTGFGFDGEPSFPPGAGVVYRTDLWSESNSGTGYQYMIEPALDTGYEYKLSPKFPGPGSGDEEIDFCVEPLS